MNCERILKFYLVIFFWKKKKFFKRRNIENQSTIKLYDINHDKIIEKIHEGIELTIVRNNTTNIVNQNWNIISYKRAFFNSILSLSFLEILLVDIINDIPVKRNHEVRAKKLIISWLEFLKKSLICLQSKRQKIRIVKIHGKIINTNKIHTLV